MRARLWLSLLSFAALPAAAISLSRDTLDMRLGTGMMTLFNPAVKFIPNPGNDSLVIDSITARAVKIHGEGQIGLRLERVVPGFDPQFLGMYVDGSGFCFYQSTRFAIARKTRRNWWKPGWMAASTASSSGRRLRPSATR